MSSFTVGVLALQGAFYEHLTLLKQAARELSQDNNSQKWAFVEVRTPAQLQSCDALIIPGGESTAISLVAARSNLLEPLREFVKIRRKPTWGTCAGLILLSESANRTKQGGQELIGGLDVRVNRNHFGRQCESFQASLNLPFLAGSDPTTSNSSSTSGKQTPFNGIFIRAPVVEKLLPYMENVQIEEQKRDETIVAPSRHTKDPAALAAMSDHVEVVAKLPGRAARLTDAGVKLETEKEAEDIVAVQQGNVFGTSFHPELTQDPRIHMWWLQQVEAAVTKLRASERAIPVRNGH